jgi:hypothetical protein
MTGLVNRLAAQSSHGLQQELRRFRYAPQLRSGRFDEREPEYAQLHTPPGDRVIDRNSSARPAVIEILRLADRQRETNVLAEVLALQRRGIGSLVDRLLA